jgi:hypothetical protein
VDILSNINVWLEVHLESFHLKGKTNFRASGYSTIIDFREIVWALKYPKAPPLILDIGLAGAVGGPSFPVDWDKV